MSGLKLLIEQEKKKYFSLLIDENKKYISENSLLKHYNDCLNDVILEDYTIEKLIEMNYTIQSLSNRVNESSINLINGDVIKFVESFYHEKVEYEKLLEFMFRPGKIKNKIKSLKKYLGGPEDKEKEIKTNADKDKGFAPSSGILDQKKMTRVQQDLADKIDVAKKEWDDAAQKWDDANERFEDIKKKVIELKNKDYSSEPNPNVRARDLKVIDTLQREARTIYDQGLPLSKDRNQKRREYNRLNKQLHKLMYEVPDAHSKIYTDKEAEDKGVTPGSSGLQRAGSTISDAIGSTGNKNASDPKFKHGVNYILDLIRKNRDLYDNLKSGDIESKDVEDTIKGTRVGKDMDNIVNRFINPKDPQFQNTLETVLNFLKKNPEYIKKITPLNPAAKQAASRYKSSPFATKWGDGAPADVGDDELSQMVSRWGKSSFA